MAIEDNSSLFNWVANETKIKESIISKVIDLMDEGNTVPFIARYRKEVTGGLDEVKIKLITDKWDSIVNLNERKEEVLRLIEEPGKLPEELKQAIAQANQIQRDDGIE